MRSTSYPNAIWHDGGRYAYPPHLHEYGRRSSSSYRPPDEISIPRVDYDPLHAAHIPRIYTEGEMRASNGFVARASETTQSKGTKAKCALITIGSLLTVLLLGVLAVLLLVVVKGRNPHVFPAYSNAAAPSSLQEPSTLSKQASQISQNNTASSPSTDDFYIFPDGRGNLNGEIRQAAPTAGSPSGALSPNAAPSPSATATSPGQLPTVSGSPVASASPSLAAASPVATATPSALTNTTTAVPSVLTITTSPSAALAPAISPVISPVASPVTSPVASPVTSPVASPVATPVASPVASPVTTPVARPTPSPAMQRPTGQMPTAQRPTQMGPNPFGFITFYPTPFHVIPPPRPQPRPECSECSQQLPVVNDDVLDDDCYNKAHSGSSGDDHRSGKHNRKRKKTRRSNYNNNRSGD